MERQPLETMHTRQLMGELRSVRAKHSVMDYMCGPPTDEERDAMNAEVDNIKSILATREHIPNKAEARVLRQYKQHRKQTR